MDNPCAAAISHESPSLKVVPNLGPQFGRRGASEPPLRGPEPDSDRRCDGDLSARRAATILPDEAGAITERPRDLPDFIDGHVETPSEASIAIRTQLVIFEESADFRGGLATRVAATRVAAPRWRRTAGPICFICHMTSESPMAEHDRGSLLTRQYTGRCIPIGPRPRGISA